MSTSVIKRRKTDVFLSGWFSISLFCLLFGQIYELFAHGVMSASMIFMFLYPLLLGFVPCVILKKLHMKMPSRLWQDGVLILTCGSLIRGVIEIYGTTAWYDRAFLICGVICLIAGIVQYLLWK